jgi:hypothetical protein
MKIHPYQHGALPALATPFPAAGGGEPDPDPTAGYSSLIGICTSIGGNILISIALNTQRYAHTKLNEQWAARRRLLRRAERRRRTAGAGPATTAYGTESTTSVGKERRRALGNGSGSEQTNGRCGDGLDESEPLMASYRRDTDDDDYDDVDNALDVGEPAEPGQKSYLHSPYWWAGIVLMTVGECGNFLAYGFAPASIVSPLGVVAIISNCIIAPLVMKEQFRWRDFYGVVTAVAGAVTIVVSAKENNPKLGPHEIWALIGTWEFETYLGITVLLITVLMLASAKYGGKSIFIDLGLVGLFGQSVRRVILPSNKIRRLHRPLNQGRCVAAVVHAAPDADLSRHVPPPSDPRLHGRHADKVRQPRAAALRGDAGHPDAVRALHPLRHHR